MRAALDRVCNVSHTKKNMNIRFVIPEPVRDDQDAHAPGLVQSEEGLLHLPLPLRVQRAVWMSSCCYMCMYVYEGTL